MRWMRAVLVVVLLVGSGVGAQTGGGGGDRFKALSFLAGTWEAKATRPDGVVVTGRYAFVPELNGTVLARRATNDPGCKGPVSFDCAHTDLLYVFADGPGAPLKAIYFDSEGHVLHYVVTATSASSAEFVSEAAGGGPQFRLLYELKGGVMLGKFQMKAPGMTEWRSYLEWSGARVLP